MALDSQKLCQRNRRADSRPDGSYKQPSQNRSKFIGRRLIFQNSTVSRRCTEEIITFDDLEEVTNLKQLILDLENAVLANAEHLRKFSN